MLLLLCFCLFFSRLLKNTIKGVDNILIKNVDNLCLFVGTRKIKYLFYIQSINFNILFETIHKFRIRQDSHIYSDLKYTNPTDSAHFASILFYKYANPLDSEFMYGLKVSNNIFSKKYLFMPFFDSKQYFCALILKLFLLN